MSRYDAHRDPFTAYQNRVTSSPIVTVLGRSGRGGEGEYADLARACGGEALHLGPGENARPLHLVLDEAANVCPSDLAVILGARSGEANA